MSSVSRYVLARVFQSTNDVLVAEIREEGRGCGVSDEMNRREKGPEGVEEGWMTECDGLVEKGGGIEPTGGPHG